MSMEALTARSVKELRSIAADLGIARRGVMKKAELIEAIRQVLAAAPGAQVPAEPRVLPSPDVPQAGSEVVTEPESLEDPPVVEVPAPDPAANEDAAALIGSGSDGDEPVEDAEPIVEPSETEVYIDRGHPLPERYSGARMRVMVRDPGTLYVYWEIPEGVDSDAWEVAAVDRLSTPLDTFRVRREANCGYLHVHPDQVGTVLLRAVQQERVVPEPVGVLEYGTPQSRPSLEEASRWVEITEAEFQQRQANLPRIAAAVRALFEVGPTTSPVATPAVGPFLQVSVQPWLPAPAPREAAPETSSFENAPPAGVPSSSSRSA